MLNLVFSIQNFYYECVIQVKNVISNYFEKTPEKGLVENNIFLLAEHILFFFSGIILFWSEEWLLNTDMIWGQELNLRIIFYYLFYTIRYLVQIQLMTGEEKDYQSMMAHHISTILLLTLSFVHYHRIGIVIALSHDIADLAFLPAKIFHKFYETRKIKILNILSYIHFVIFFLLFFLTRIILNSKLILCTYDHFFYPEDLFLIHNPGIYFEGYVLLILLHVNLAIQIFWQFMIIKFSYNLIVGGKPKDEKGNEYFKPENKIKSS